MPTETTGSPPEQRLAKLELICFGPPTARLDGALPPPDVLWRKHLALLIYLALSPKRTRTRDHLLGQLWPEKSQSKARHSLNEAVRRLRVALGAGRLVTHGDSLTLEDTALKVDVWDFDAAVSAGSPGAAELATGDLLEGFVLSGAPEFERWATQRSDRYRSRVAEALLEDGQQALAQLRFRTAQDLARRALETQPYFEPAARLLMQVLALAGDSSGALAAGREFTDRLQRDVAEKPGRDFRALSDRIRKESWRVAPGVGSETEPPLTHRAHVHGRAFGTLREGLVGGPRVLLIQGEPGTGKTRLLTECLDRLALEGAATAIARPLESDYDAPWSTLRSLMRAGLLEAPGLVATGPDSLAVLASIVPELAGRISPKEPRDNAHVAAALASLFEAVADENPLALGLDDAHLSDGATIGALAAAVSQLQGKPVVVVVASTYAPDQVPRELLRLEGEIGRALPGTTVLLEPLTEVELEELVTSLAEWCDDPSDRDRLTRRVFYESGGNLLLAVELLRGLAEVAELREDVFAWPQPHATLESPLPIGVPALVQRSLVARVMELDQEAKAVLRAASIGSRRVDVDLTSSLTGVSKDGVEDQLARLERHHFVTFDGDRYAFSASVIPQVVEAALFTPGELRRLRADAVAWLTERADVESQVLRAQLQSHLDPGPEALEVALTAARAALDAETVRAAKRAIVAAERSAKKVGDVAYDAVAELKALLQR